MEPKKKKYRSEEVVPLAREVGITEQIASLIAHKGTKKVWRDSLIDAANKPKPEGKLTEKEKKKWLPERRLRAFLRTIARFKHGMIPEPILKELNRVHRTSTLRWFPVFHGDKLPEDPLTWPGSHLYSTRMDPSKFDDYLTKLIPRLYDPVWVAALKKCPECGKLLLSLTKWPRKFCSPSCKNRHKQRKHRERVKEEKNIEQEGEDYREAKIELRCRSCEWQESKGEFENYIKSYSRPMDCPKCGNMNPLHIVTTWDREVKDWRETSYSVVEFEDFIDQYRKERRVYNDMAAD